MKAFPTALRAFLLALLIAFAAPAFAQSSTADPAALDQAAQEIQRQKEQPGNNAPVWREIRSGQPQSVNVPGRETDVLIQTEGQMWRAKRNGFWSVISGWALVGMIGLLAFAYFFFGINQTHEPESGRKLLRFTQWERWVHWTVAITFGVLACTGIVMLFGKNIMLPIIGYTLFSWLAGLSKNLHNFLGPLFVVSLLTMFVTYVRGNIPKSHDMPWIKALGGLLLKKGEHEPPSGKFNAGEKIWFWGGAVVLGLAVGITGLILDFPNFDQTRSTMQLANILHLIATTLLMLGGMGHAYLGTVATPGAYEGMRDGIVDEQWAKEHHRFWYDDIKSGKINADPDQQGGVARRHHPASGSAD